MSFFLFPLFLFFFFSLPFSFHFLFIFLFIFFIFFGIGPSSRFGPCPSFLWWWLPLPSGCGASPSLFGVGVGSSWGMPLLSSRVGGGGIGDDPPFSRCGGWPFLLRAVFWARSSWGWGWPCLFRGGGWPFLVGVEPSFLGWRLALLRVGALSSSGFGKAWSSP